MSKRTVDRTKKSNIKCEHCFYADANKCLRYWCVLHQKEKNYWNRCKDFMWGEEEIEQE